MARLATLALTALGLVGCASAPKAIDCQQNAGSIAETLCRSPELNHLNTLLGRSLKTLQLRLTASALQAINSDQRDWEDALIECWESEMPRSCLAERLRLRNAALQAEYRLVESSRPYHYHCDDDPDTPVITTYHLTEPPSLVLQRGSGHHLLFLKQLTTGTATYYGEHISVRVAGDRAEISWGYSERSDPQTACRIHP